MNHKRLALYVTVLIALLAITVAIFIRSNAQSVTIDDASEQFNLAKSQIGTGFQLDNSTQISDDGCENVPGKYVSGPVPQVCRYVGAAEYTILQSNSYDAINALHSHLIEQGWHVTSDKGGGVFTKISDRSRQNNYGFSAAYQRDDYQQMIHLSGSKIGTSKKFTLEYSIVYKHSE